MSVLSEKSGPDEIALADGLLHFLSSLGKRSEAELYLRLFRGLPAGRFALLVPTAGVLEEHVASLVEQLAFLANLGLFPTVLAGAMDCPTEQQLEGLEHSLREAGVGFRTRHLSEDSLQTLSPSSASELSLYVMKQPSGELLEAAVARLLPRKTVILRRAGGLGKGLGPRLEISPGHVLPLGGGGIGVINMRSDASELRASRLLHEDDAAWMNRCERLLDVLADSEPRATISIASPLSLLRELFTVRGEGTLLKRGSTITRLQAYGPGVKEAIEHLLGEAFSRPVVPAFFARTPYRIYLEQHCRGLALLEKAPENMPGSGAFLSKFAVLPVAQGEGVGQDLFWELSKDTPSFYWRSRVENPINGWYSSVCDGFHRTGDWNVFWKGMPPESLPRLIADAVSRPEDFLP